MHQCCKGLRCFGRRETRGVPFVELDRDQVLVEVRPLGRVMAWPYASRPVLARMPSTAAAAVAVAAAALHQPLKAKTADLPRLRVMEWPVCSAAELFHPGAQMEATSSGHWALGGMLAGRATLTALGSPLCLPQTASVLGILLEGFSSMAMKLVTISSCGELPRWRKMVGGQRWKAGGKEAQLVGVAESICACPEWWGLTKLGLLPILNVQLDPLLQAS